MYWSHRSLSSAAGNNNLEKKDFFNRYYLAVFKTKYPYLGLLASAILTALISILFNLDTFLLRAIIAAPICGLLYFQFHCFALDNIAKKHKSDHL